MDRARQRWRETRLVRHRVKEPEPLITPDLKHTADRKCQSTACTQWSKSSTRYLAACNLNRVLNKTESVKSDCGAALLCKVVHEVIGGSAGTPDNHDLSIRWQVSYEATRFRNTITSRSGLEDTQHMTCNCRSSKLKVQ